MTESQQSKRGWFSTWRSAHRQAKREEILERERFAGEQADEPGIRRTSRAYHRSGPVAYWTGFGGDGGGGGGGGGGCGGDGGGGGC